MMRAADYAAPRWPVRSGGRSSLKRQIAASPAAIRGDALMSGIWDGLWSDPGAIYTSTAVAIALAIYGVRSQRNVARQRHTLESIASRMHNPDYLKQRQEFIRLRALSEKELVKLAR